MVAIGGGEGGDGVIHTSLWPVFFPLWSSNVATQTSQAC